MEQEDRKREVIEIMDDEQVDAMDIVHDTGHFQPRRTGFAAGVPNPTTLAAQAAAAPARGRAESVQYPGDGNIDHVLALNLMFFSDTVVAKVPASTGPQPRTERQLLTEAAERLLSSAHPPPPDNEWLMASIGQLPCKPANCSKDGKGQYQYTFRVPHLADIRPQGLRMRPWHITWVGTYGMAPIGLTYSHRCPIHNCVEPSHGVWETDVANKSRNYCKTAAQVGLPDGTLVTVCPHVPCCLNLVLVVALDDRRLARWY